MPVLRRAVPWQAPHCSVSSEPSGPVAVSANSLALDVLRRPNGKLLPKNLGVVADVDRQRRVQQEVVDRFGQRIARRKPAKLVDQPVRAHARLPANGLCAARR